MGFSQGCLDNCLSAIRIWLTLHQLNWKTSKTRIDKKRDRSRVLILFIYVTYIEKTISHKSNVVLYINKITKNNNKVSIIILTAMLRPLEICLVCMKCNEKTESHIRRSIETLCVYITQSKAPDKLYAGKPDSSRRSAENFNKGMLSFVTGKKREK